jgi:hypothetical protein
MHLDIDSWRASLWRRAPQAGAAAPRLSNTRNLPGATTPVEKRPSGGEGVERPASRAIDAPNPLYVDTTEPGHRSSGPTFTETAVEPGVLL